MPETLLDFVTSKPFRPFQIHTASGRTFLVSHPEMIMVGLTSADIYQRPKAGESQGERWQRVSLVLMESVEPLDTNASVGSH